MPSLPTLLLLLFTTLTFHLTHSIPLPRSVPLENCTSVTSGTLTGGLGQQFHLTRNGTLAYGGSGHRGLKVEFQRCDPNFAAFPQNKTLISGHLYLPSHSQCLSVQHPALSPPHQLTLDDCSISDDSSQILFQFLQLNNTGITEFVWAGFTDSRGNIQNPSVCPSGTFGFLGPSDISDPITHGIAQIVCLQDEGALPFRIV